MKRVKQKRVKRRFFIFIIFLFVAVFGIFMYLKAIKEPVVEKLYNTAVPEYVNVQYIPKGVLYSRSSLELNEVKNIVIHYVGNPNTTAQQNRDYFANSGTKVNSHFVIGLDGEVIQCIPLYERSSASNWRNKDTISIEVCHPDATGKFNDVTLKSLIELTAWLCKTCELDAKDIIRHYDITEKLCPLYFVEHEDEWISFRADVQRIIDKK